MIKEIFLPEKIGDRYLFSQRIVGIDIGKTHVHATCTVMNGTSVTIEHVIEEKIEAAKNSHPERTASALRALFAKLPKPDQIRTALPSTQIVFKELKLPFVNESTVAQVIRFEVEPLLPFALNDAIVDFIITKKYPELNSSEILVAAVQKQIIAQHLALFEQAGISPDIITIDMFALYGLYQQIPAYKDLSGTNILIDWGSQSTRLAAVLDGQLKMIRTIPYGTHTLAKDVSTATNISPQQAIEYMIRFGLEKGDATETHQAIMNAVMAFMHRLQFALTSMAGRDKKINQILILGDGATLKGIAPIMTDFLQAPVAPFNIMQITTNQRYHIKNGSQIASTAIIGVGTALPTPILDQFNLRKDDFSPHDDTLLLKQLVTGGLLIIILFASLITHSIIQTRRLSREIKTSQQEVIESLKEHFPSISEDEDDLEEVISQAQIRLSREREMWAPFSRENRASFLEYLLELSTKINKQELGFVPEQLIITDNVITLKGRVSDFPQLTQLYQALKESPLFSSVERPQTPSFSIRIATTRRGGV